MTGDVSEKIGFKERHKRTMRSIHATAAALLIFMFCAPSYADDQSQCAACHTSAGKLIQITRQIAKDRPVVESKSTGPG
jgi:hypothetical protein